MRVRAVARAVVLAVALAVACAVVRLPDGQSGAGRHRGAVPDGAARVALVGSAVARPGQPPPPEEAAAAARLEQVQHEAEVLTEQWHAATDELTARRADLQRLTSAVEPARTAAESAREEEERYREQADAVTAATFESGRLDALNALLVAASPQEYLDRMSALETISADHALALDRLRAVVDRTRQAEGEADAAVARARSAADDAARAEQDLAARKREADARIAEAERLLERLGPRERAARAGAGEDAPPAAGGTGVGGRALRAAATQLGKSYEWGAEGPDTFDCSGLTSWAFRKAGVTLPRSSAQQAKTGKPVSWDDLRPGDLVFYYQPVSHVGIYAGAGKMIHSPQTGDVVKYQTVRREAFSGARRL